MTALNLERLAIRPQDLSRVLEVLRSQAQGVEVWAFGSRVDGSGHEASDLDLVVRQPKDLTECFSRLDQLRAAFRESDLPIRVDLLDWARIPDSFRREIERTYVVMQVAPDPPSAIRS